MSENHCANCGKGIIEFHNVKDFKTRVRGASFTVPEASVGICNSCGAKFYSPDEIRRWRQLFDAEQLAGGKLLRAEEVASIRQGLGLSVSSFASLLGTTRQSVYNWERNDRKSPQLRLVDLLLRLVSESVANGMVDVLEFLSEQTGVELECASGARRCPPVFRPRRRDSRRRWCDPAQFDQAFGTAGPAKALPSLRSY